MNFGWRIDESCYSPPVAAAATAAASATAGGTTAPVSSAAPVTTPAAGVLNNQPAPAILAAPTCPTLPNWWLALIAGAAIAGLATRRTRR